ncbi:hypothetical protein J5N97_018735 [Dioscorea zingiberensis]|uniref:Uncharacterized protein n=1 Tax=Dioscorea zingiberensis TaxID=325984 RepID=A0A9D5CCG5_9LILI|nr:hypothetical protein J5N97_018735 [Dioscorea zingiberensis]
MLSIVRQNPFNDGSHYWYYVLQGPIDVRDAPSLSIDTLPPPPSLTVSLIFATRRPDSISEDYMAVPQPIESNVFNMDIKSFTNRFSAEQAINSMFMNTLTGRSLSLERRFWTVTTVSESIRRYFHGSMISGTSLDANIIFQLVVVDHEMDGSSLHEEMEEDEEEHFRQEFSEDLLEDEEESFEDHEVGYPSDEVPLACESTVIPSSQSVFWG